jgi:DNA mismatch endonuclease, patch repair protein
MAGMKSAHGRPDTSVDPEVPTGSWASTIGVRRSMQSNTPRNTRPERLLRSELHRSGLRFRKHVRLIPGSRCEVDIAFTRLKVAVFVDGCFWHCCPEHATFPVRNGEWWSKKLARNRERDLHSNEILRDLGWTVMRIWEHVLPADAAVGVRALVGSAVAKDNDSATIHAAGGRTNRRSTNPKTC